MFKTILMIISVTITFLFVGYMTGVMFASPQLILSVIQK